MTPHLLTPEEWHALSADSRHAIERMEARLATAQRVIAVFVYPASPMTPAQREVWAEFERAMGVEQK